VATVTLTVTADNDVPVARDDGPYTTAEDTALTVPAPGVLGNDSDPDGDLLGTLKVSEPQHGTLTLGNDGSFTYTPAPDYNGSDAFKYEAVDGHGGVSDVATVAITVSAVNDAPTVTVVPGGSCGGNDRSGTINLTVADTDGAAGSLSLSRATSNPALVPVGDVSFAGSGATRSMTVTAAAGAAGSATITVTVSDGSASSSLNVAVRAGGNGSDTINGTAGTDVLLGQNGDDTLDGQSGIDLLCGARGNDRLTGGADADRFGGGSGVDVATDLTTSQGDTQDGTIPSIPRLSRATRRSRAAEPPSPARGSLPATRAVASDRRRSRHRTSRTIRPAADGCGSPAPPISPRIRAT
jgi:Ca2+-binding RTX toxin-like protein